LFLRLLDTILLLRFLCIKIFRAQKELTTKTQSHKNWINIQARDFAPGNYQDWKDVKFLPVSISDYY
jgi:hypothetical protein